MSSEGEMGRGSIKTSCRISLAARSRYSSDGAARHSKTKRKQSEAAAFIKQTCVMPYPLVVFVVAFLSRTSTPFARY